MSRLLLVEGIPGSGKTRTAQALSRLLAERGQATVAYLEGQAQPADLAWQWWLTPVEFQGLLARFPHARDEVERNAWRGLRGVSLAYNAVDRGRVGPSWSLVEQELAGHEPFGGAVAPATFVDLLEARWAEFGRRAAHDPGFVVFEAALLQDTLVELVLFADWDLAQIAGALTRLLAAVTSLDPVLVRLLPGDPAAAVRAAAADRVDDQGRGWWLPAAEAYTADTPWARARGLVGGAALREYLARRVEVEDQLRELLPVTWLDLTSPAGEHRGWDRFDGELAVLADRLVGASAPPQRPGGSPPTPPRR